MTGEADLLAAVARAPWADAPRLVLADFLDDRNGPGDADRAALIRATPRRIECTVVAGQWMWHPLQRDSVPPSLWVATLDALKPADWLRTVPAPAGADRRRLAVLRLGFVDEITLPLAAFLADPARVGRITGLTGVVLGDREPAEERERDGGDRFRWVCNDGSASGLPEVVYSRLTGYTTAAAWTGVVKDYPTRAAALAALSAAALALARSAAGLGPA
jgi:uncharacterized protein (TIGR02996 family)